MSRRARVYVGTCPECLCWLQSATPSAQPHYDTCHPGTLAPGTVLS